MCLSAAGALTTALAAAAAAAAGFEDTEGVL
jgi:hypothetical protein